MPGYEWIIVLTHELFLFRQNFAALTEGAGKILRVAQPGIDGEITKDETIVRQFLTDAATYTILGLGKWKTPSLRVTWENCRTREKMTVNRQRKKLPVPLWRAAVYCVTCFVPIFHTLRGIIRDGGASWFWPLPTCPASVFSNAWWGLFTYKLRGKDKKFIAEMQVKQTLKKGSTNATSCFTFALDFLLVGRNSMLMIDNMTWSVRLDVGKILPRRWL